MTTSAPDSAPPTVPGPSSPEADPAPADGGRTAREEGRSALARGAWEDAVQALRTAVEEHPEDAAAWESLGIAHGWLQETDDAVEARQRAFALYRERGDDAASARVALELANDFFEVRGEPAVANGWFQRARRLLQDLPPCQEHALLKVWDAYMALTSQGDPVAAEAHAAEGVSVARETGARDAGILCLALQGLARVGQGRAGEGLDLLDEAVAGALGGEVTDPQWFFLTCCCMIDACDQVRDYGRSLEWCRRLREFCDRWRVQAFLTNCRIKYTGALLWRGEWDRCEEELEQAAAELRGHRPSAVPGALVRLAELRRRQGQGEEAARLLDEVGSHPLEPTVRAALALDQGTPEEALTPVQGLLRRLSDSSRTERAAALELLVRALLALGRVDEARTAAEDLTSIGDLVGTPALKASALAARGLVSAADSEHAEARSRLEDALYLFQEGGAPFETARVRLELARSLEHLGERPRALREARRALETLQGLGARGEAERARALAASLEEAGGGEEDGRNGGAGVGAATPGAGRKGPLTKRQREVLALAAEGLTDREIAQRLYLSEHTVHRHMANIMTRLRVTSRTAAVAQGVREGWI